MQKVVIFFIFLQYVSSNENSKSYIFEKRNRNSYYFRLGRNNNEVKVNNRIYFLNHNITDLDYPNGRVENIRRLEENSVHVSIAIKYWEISPHYTLFLPNHTPFHLRKLSMMSHPDSFGDMSVDIVFFFQNFIAI